MKEFNKVKLNMYMAYDGKAGIDEGACLVFAHTAREAKIIVAQVIKDWGSEYVDIAVKRIRKATWLQEEQVSDSPHVVEDPLSCNGCGLWGQSMIVDGLCKDCKGGET